VLDIGDEQDRQTDHDRQRVVAQKARTWPGLRSAAGGAASSSPVLFNFLGQFDTDIGRFEIADDNRGPSRARWRG
jgi:hypothetical protein